MKRREEEHALEFKNAQLAYLLSIVQLKTWDEKMLQKVYSCGKYP